MNSLWLLLPVAGMCLVIARDAWKDKTPRVPRMPERVFWAQKKTARERLNVHVQVKGKVA
jgi:hypothetical protein